MAENPPPAALPRICLTAEEFVIRHDICLDDFYALLTKGLHLLPKTLRISGRVYLNDKAGATGRRFTTRVNLPDAPEDEKDRVFFTVGAFCHCYGLTYSDLLNHAVRRELPFGYRARLIGGEVVVSAEDVALWELARQAEAVAS